MKRVKGSELAQHIGWEVYQDLFTGAEFESPLNWFVLKSVTAEGIVEFECESTYGIDLDGSYLVREVQERAAVKPDAKDKISLLDVRGNELSKYVGYEFDLGFALWEPQEDWHVIESVSPQGDVKLGGTGTEFQLSAEAFFRIRKAPEKSPS